VVGVDYTLAGGKTPNADVKPGRPEQNAATRRYLDGDRASVPRSPPASAELTTFGADQQHNDFERIASQLFAMKESASKKSTACFSCSAHPRTVGGASAVNFDPSELGDRQGPDPPSIFYKPSYDGSLLLPVSLVREWKRWKARPPYVYDTASGQRLAGPRVSRT
jgi:hypothetical protein